MNSKPTSANMFSFGVYHKPADLALRGCRFGGREVRVEQWRGWQESEGEEDQILGLRAFTCWSITCAREGGSESPGSISRRTRHVGVWGWSGQSVSKSEIAAFQPAVTLTQRLSPCVRVCPRQPLKGERSLRAFLPVRVPVRPSSLSCLLPPPPPHAVFLPQSAACPARGLPLPLSLPVGVTSARPLLP